MEKVIIGNSDKIIRNKISCTKCGSVFLFCDDDIFSAQNTLGHTCEWVRRS